MTPTSRLGSRCADDPSAQHLGQGIVDIVGLTKADKSAHAVSLATRFSLSPKQKVMPIVDHAHDFGSGRYAKIKKHLSAPLGVTNRFA
jgi:hypothetical protein